MNVSAKVWAVIAALIAVLAFTVTRLSHSGSDFKHTVTDYECNIQVTTNPEPFRQEILATITYQCKTPPKTTSLILNMQHKNSAGTWVDAVDPKLFSGATAGTKVAVNVSAPCAAGDWRVGYHFTGFGAATGTPFTEEQKWSSTSSVSAADCANS